MPNLRNALPSAPQLVCLLVFVALGGGAGYLIWGRDDEPADFGFKARDKPGEYLYLDAQRVLTYLPQALGGLPGNETQSLTLTRQLTLDLKGTAGPSVGSSLERERTTERTLSATAASRLFLLIDSLIQTEQLQLIDLPDIAERADELEEGDFVRITNVELRMPDYASDYDIHKTRKDVIAAAGAGAYTRSERRRITRFIGAAGENPRVSFLAEVTTDESPDAPKFSILLPAQYAQLAVEPTLLTGRQTVLGKVMRNLKLPAEGQSGFVPDRYSDTATIASFRPALRALPQFAIDLHSEAARDALRQTRLRLGLSREDASFQERLKEFRESPLRSREGLQRDLARDTTITAPGLVLLPLAIYK